MPEKEMGKHQCSLVDNCFEEGQYMQGIAYLDQLRLIDQRPSPYVYLEHHLYTLIFYQGSYPPIDLHRPLSSSEGDRKSKRKEKRAVAWNRISQQTQPSN